VLLVERVRSCHGQARAVRINPILRLFCFSATLLAPVSVSAQQVVDLDELVRRGDAYLDAASMEPHSGPVERHWSGNLTGQSGAVLRERGTLVEGRWDGIHEWFHLSGELATRENYLAGRLNGSSETFFKTGQLSAKESYADGVLHGPYESFWHRGRLAERGQWSGGQPCGVWFSFGRTLNHTRCPRG
jgi:hypothetical protein